MATQYEEAKRLLSIIAVAVRSQRTLTYQMAAVKLGRPENNARTVAQVCDLLDAAAALANVPLLALTKVLTSSLRVNPDAWAEAEPWIRDAIIRRSQSHKFTEDDFRSIGQALEKLKGYSNRRAWPYLRKLIPHGQLRLRVAGVGTPEYSDAVDDLGADNPDFVIYVGKRYERNPQVREAVLRRAAGKCEYCGERGFKRSDGARYLECHHIIALADEGADRVTNVIALCPGDHREAHFGARRAEIEAEMIAKVKAAEARHAKMSRV